MRSGVYEMVERPSVTVCPSVSLIIQSQQWRAAGLLLSASAARVGRRASSSNGATARRSVANAGSAMSTAELTRLNTDLFL